MIIDAHSHGLHGGHLDKVEAAAGSWSRERVAFFRKRAQGKPVHLDLDLRIEQLKRNNIDLQVVTPSVQINANLLPGDTSAQLALAIAINDNMARLMEESKGKLLAGGNVPLANFEQGGYQEMERAIKTLGLKVISVPTNLNGKPLDLPEFEPFWAHAAETGTPVYIHPWYPSGNTDRSYEAEFNLYHSLGMPFETALILFRLVFSGLMERYPTIKILGHHLGGMVPFFWGRITETYASEADQQSKIGRVLPRPIFDYFSLFYYDTAVGGSAAATRCAYDVFGANRLVFATDYPLGPGTGENRLATYPDVIRSLGLSGAENERIFEGNARQLLNLI